MNQAVLLTQLKKQLGFIERSCASFDAGFYDEAIRIAVSIRILIHDTKNSTSLLSHLGAKGMSLRTTCPLIDDRVIMFSGGLCLTQVTVENGQLKEAGYKPIFDSSEPKNLYVAADVWWNQTIYKIAEGDVTRKHIVLGAANKDGGAHVDPLLTSEYEALSKGIWTIGHSSSQGNLEFPLPNSHLADLRQMGHELLTSPELVCLIPRNDVQPFAPAPG
ncbi:MAG: hypothetical protein K0M48_01830 [Thiobacillus sp.]|nr:hypothetical protein [Thiobacillus sp.]